LTGRSLSRWKVSVLLLNVNIKVGIGGENLQEFWSNDFEIVLKIESNLGESFLNGKLLRIILSESLLKNTK
jgi:hypothetical protein